MVKILDFNWETSDKKVLIMYMFSFIYIFLDFH